jgi:hypothetical protein
MINRHFLRHYAEMVAAMFIGMAVLWTPATLVIGSDPGNAAILVTMGVTMTVPMVGWMRFRGHDWRPSLEMAASMIVPTLIALGLVVANLDFGAILLGEHVVMLAAMFGVMLLRPDEYSHNHAQVAA